LKSLKEAKGAVPQNLGAVTWRMKRLTKDSLREEEAVGDRVKGEEKELIMRI
jgi:hypothetical protein